LTGRPDRGGSAGASDSSLVAELARVLGHELAEIAALLDGYTEELLGPSVADDAVSRLRGTTARLREIYEDLLELTKVASAPLARSAVDPAAALAAAQQRLQGRAGTSAADVDIDIPSLPPVIADPGQLEQLFEHLLRSVTSTAISGDRSGLIVRGSREGPDVRLDIGADRALPTRAEPRLADSLVGCGVVLAVSSHIAARNGGRLWVRGDQRSGRTISVSLPAAEP
jgi:signal transduction histidine kinase